MSASGRESLEGVPEHASEMLPLILRMRAQVSREMDEELGPPLDLSHQEIELNRQLSTGDVYVEILRVGSQSSLPTVLPTVPQPQDPALEFALAVGDALQGTDTRDEYSEHLMSVKEVTDVFDTHVDETNPNISPGLSTKEVEKRIRECGGNVLTSPPRISLFILFLIQFSNIFMVLLLVAAILCFVAFAIDTSDLTNL